MTALSATTGPRGSGDDVAAYAAALLPRAIAALEVVPDADRGAALAALDQFLTAPGPAAFLRAIRVLDQARRTARLNQAARTTVGRLFDEGMDLLRAVPGLPAEVTAQLAADLPVDARAGRRLTALATLLQGYEELLGRVVADTEEMRRRLRPGARRGMRRDRWRL
jgi:hypothetical protein